MLFPKGTKIFNYMHNQIARWSVRMNIILLSTLKRGKVRINLVAEHFVYCRKKADKFFRNIKSENAGMSNDKKGLKNPFAENPRFPKKC